MNAEETLFSAYREWHRLAKAAHKAIGKRDWGFLLECQAVIRRIQPSITDLHREVSEKWKRSNADCAAKKKRVERNDFGVERAAGIQQAVASRCQAIGAR